MNAFFGITWNITSTTPVYVTAYNMQTGAQDYTSVLQPPTGLPNDFGATIEETYLYNGHYYCFIKQTMQWAMWNCRIRRSTSLDFTSHTLTHGAPTPKAAVR